MKKDVFSGNGIDHKNVLAFELDSSIDFRRISMWFMENNQILMPIQQNGIDRSLYFDCRQILMEKIKSFGN